MACFRSERRVVGVDDVQLLPDPIENAIVDEDVRAGLAHGLSERYRALGELDRRRADRAAREQSFCHEDRRLFCTQVGLRFNLPWRAEAAWRLDPRGGACDHERRIETKYDHNLSNRAQSNICLSMK